MGVANKKIRVGIVGATGYTGMELLRLLLRHPQAEIALVTSEKYAGKRLDQVFPHLQRQSRLILEELEDDQIADKCDVVFSCLPHKSAMSHIAVWARSDVRIIDLSADFRLRSQEDYETWYGERHLAAHLLKNAVYGLPEIHRKEIQKSSLIGNPGCYPTGAILGLVPLIQEKIIDVDSIIIDSKSGVTGAGRSAVLESLFCEVNDSVHAYKVGGKHRHIGEIEQELSLAAGKPVVISFTPHLIPMDRGILTTIYANAVKKTDTKVLLSIFSEFYKKEPFIRVLPEGVLPRTKEVRGSNTCALGAVFDPRTQRIIVITAIDNLLKGASSQAVQNMNILFGLSETTGLESLALIP